MALDVPSTLPFIVLKLPLHCAKGISDGDIRVFMSMLPTMFTLRDELSPGDGYLNVDFINMPLTTMFVRKLDHHPAVSHLGAESLETLRRLPDTGFKCGRRLHTSPSDLNWQRHLLSRFEWSNTIVGNYCAIEQAEQ